MLVDHPAPRAVAPALQPARRAVWLPERKVLGYLGLHVLLALFLNRSFGFAPLFPLIVTTVGLLAATRIGTQRLALTTAGYIAASDVLWRMTGTSLFWEFGKYASVAVLAVSILRRRQSPRTWLPVVYFLCLIPGAILTFRALDFEFAREFVSFNLSGPLLLCVATLTFCGLRAESLRLRIFLTALLGPITSISTLTSLRAGDVSKIVFDTHSNFAMSGGYGPNQVSAILGFGGVACALLALERKHGQFFFAGLGLLFSVQALLTFSRGGVLNLVVALTLFLVHFIADRGLRLRILAATSLCLLIGWLFVLPRVDEITSGRWVDRYTDFESANRVRLFSEDLELFRENPVFGVGAGMGAFNRRLPQLEGIAPHTEFSRLIAEHGAFGLLAAILLFGMVGKAYLTAPSSLAKGWVAGLTGWVFVEMTHAAIRIAIIGLVFGLAMIDWSGLSWRRRS